MMGIRDILGADPYLSLTDPNPKPTEEPTPFFSDFKEAK
jgi:hypothetical protein